jgi:hypothetical protein
MQFKRSAGVFVAGVTLVVAGPLLSLIGATFGSWSIASLRDGNMSGAFLGLAALGGLVSFIGFILLVVAAHRALVKIDALPVRAQPSRQDWIHQD